jgi:RNA polymerase sigma factor for flagellar operon FliA
MMVYSMKEQIDYTALVKQYMPLVKKIASSIYRKINFAVELDDLVQSGSMGLMDSLHKYIATDKAKFETYASTKIRGSILDQLRKNDHLSQEDRQLYKLIEETTKNLLVNNKTQPTDKEIAQSCGIDIEDYFKVMNRNYVNTLISIEDNEEAYEISDGAETPEVVAQKKEMISLISEKITLLSDREQILMQLLYVDDLDAKEAAYVMELTPARVSQLHTQAIKRLKELLS